MVLYFRGLPPQSHNPNLVMKGTSDNSSEGFSTKYVTSTAQNYQGLQKWGKSYPSQEDSKETG